MTVVLNSNKPIILSETAFDSAYLKVPALSAVPVTEEGVHHHEVEGVGAGPPSTLHTHRHVRNGHVVFAKVYMRATVP